MCSFLARRKPVVISATSVGQTQRQFCCNSAGSNFRSSPSIQSPNSNSASGGTLRQARNSSQNPVPRITICHDERETAKTTLTTSEKVVERVPKRDPNNSRLGISSSSSTSGGSGGSNSSFSESSKRLIGAHEEYERQIWRAARNYRQSDHYDYSLFGSSSDLDQAVARHQREAMQYSQGESFQQIPSFCGSVFIGFCLAILVQIFNMSLCPICSCRSRRIATIQTLFSRLARAIISTRVLAL